MGGVSSRRGELAEVPGRRASRSSAAAMAGCPRRWNCRSTASTRSCWKRASSGSAPARATAAGSAAGSISARVSRRRAGRGRAGARRSPAGGWRRRVRADRAADRGGRRSSASGRSAAASSAPGRRRISPIRQSGSRSLNDAAQSGAYMVPRERQREEIASDYYYGGMVVERSASLHPALYYKGLLDACRAPRRRRSAPRQRSRGSPRNGAGWRVATSRGAVSAGDVVIATNGYTGDADPGAAPPHRADRQPHHRHRGTCRPISPRSLIPKRPHARPTPSGCCAITGCRPTASAWCSAAALGSPR